MLKGHSELDGNRLLLDGRHGQHPAPRLIPHELSTLIRPIPALLEFQESILRMMTYENRGERPDKLNSNKSLRR